MANTNRRVGALDAARGVAVLVMIAFHFGWDVQTFWPIPVWRLPDRFWVWGGSLIGGSFLFIAGVSTSLALREKKRGGLALRGLKLLCLGCLLSAVTFAVLPQSPIYFGILHCIGVSLIVLSAVVESRRALWACVGAAFFLGLATEFVEGSGPWLVWAGVAFEGFLSIDYFPLFPWGGVLVLGALMGQKLFSTAQLSASADLSGLRWMGRHSLIIYLLHQPVLIGALKAFGRLCFGP